MAGWGWNLSYTDALREIGKAVGWVGDVAKDGAEDLYDYIVNEPGADRLVIDFLRIQIRLPALDHDLTDDTFAEKLVNIVTGNVQGRGDPSDIGALERVVDNFTSWMGETGGETQAEKNVRWMEAQRRENTIAEANRTVSELLGSATNWERFFNFLTGRDVMMLGPSTEIDTLQEIWDAIAVNEVPGLPSGQGADSLNLQIPADRQQFKEILANPGIYQRQFGTAPPEDDVERDAIIDEFINTVQGRTNFIVVGGMAKSLLDQVEGLEVGPSGQFILPAAEGAGQAAYDEAIAADKSEAEASRLREEAKKGTDIGTRDFLVPTFDGTQQGIIGGVGDLIAGMSLNPQEVQDRLNGLPDDQLALVQSQLWQFGYFDTPQGPEDFQWGVSGDSTYRAMERMLVNLLTEQRDKGSRYPVETMLTERRKNRSIRMRETFVSAEVDEKRAIRNSVIQQVTTELGGPLDEALRLALEESGVSLTTKGRAVYKEKIEEALKTVGMTQPELDAAYAESQRRDDTEMLLAAYYTNGSYIGDWSQSITVGGNTDSDWADFGIMAGVITPDEADILYRPVNRMPPSEHAQRDAIRQKLGENEVEIARTAMNWWIAQQTYTDSATGQQTISHVDALRGYANTIGRYTASMNEYNDNTFNQLSESLTGPVASQWLLDETQGDDIPGDVTDRIAQAAVDALGLPDAAPDISGAGSIRRVLEALAGTGGPRGLRYG
jgi:hypothetical protein